MGSAVMVHATSVRKQSNAQQHKHNDTAPHNDLKASLKRSGRRESVCKVIYVAGHL